MVSIFLCVLANWAPLALAQQKVAYVLEIEGTWTLKGNAKPLALGQSLPAKGILSNDVPRDNDHIVVADLRGEVIKTIHCMSRVCRECRVSGGCYDPIQPIPDATARVGTISVIVEAVLEFFAGKPNRYSVHRVRGSDVPEGGDSVARLNGITTDTIYFMKGRVGGQYELQFSALLREPEDKTDWNSGNIKVDWNSSHASVLTLDGIRPGLYQLRAQHGGEVSISWVLFLDATDYPSAAASFEQFTSQVNTWGDRVNEDTKRSYQRACLEYLATHSPRPAK